MKNGSSPNRVRAELDVLTDVSGLNRTVAGRLTPADREEVIDLVRWAREEKAHLYPISCGKNWGFGSHLPTEENAYLLDLSRMQAIRRVDWARDFVEIEPGVTQGMLDKILKEHGRTHYFNVTGAGRATSVIGNALERGIGYFGSKQEDILDLEIVLGDGSTLWTSEVSGNPFHTGLGPDLKGLFFQSNFGVVTAARIKLRKRPECMGVILAPLLARASFPLFIDQIVALRRESAFTSVPHIGNRQRMISTFGAAWSTMASAENASAIPDWSCAIPISGSKAVVQGIFADVSRRLKTTSQCQLISPDMGEVDARYANLIDLALGIPNDFALPAVSYAALSQAPENPLDIDGGRAGLIHVTPTCPAQGLDVSRLLTRIDQLRKEEAWKEIPMTLNLVNSGMMAVIISIPFDRGVADAPARARRLAEQLLETCGKRGCIPYRLGLEDAPILPPMSESRARLLRTLQKALDPDGIFSPSKYDPLWNRPSVSLLAPKIHPRPIRPQPALEVHT